MKMRLCLLGLFIVIGVPFSDAYARTIDLIQGKAEVVDIAGRVADVVVASPSLVEVGVMQNGRLYLVGSGVGATNIIVFDANGGVLEQMNVTVRVDYEGLGESLRTFFPNEEIIADTVGTDIVLRGSVSTPAVASQVRDLASRFIGGDDTEASIVNLMNVRGEQQVMLRVRIIEATRSVLNELGINSDLDLEEGALSLDLDSAGIQTGLTAAQRVGTGVLNFAIPGSSTFGLSFEALERDGLITTLSEPNLTAISGEEAGILVGGRFPIPTAQDQQGRPIVELVPFGVSLNFKPEVLSENRISLQMITEVSNVSNENSFQFNGLNIPGFTVRRAQTTVELGSGNTLMIAGLIQSDMVHSLNNVPGIKDVPVLGDLMRSESFARDETELLVMVTPYLVEPYQDSSTTRRVKTKKTPYLEALFEEQLLRAFGVRSDMTMYTTSGDGFFIE